MTDLHTWIVFIHVAGVLGFLTAHGVSAGVALRLRGERDPAAVRTLVDLSRRSMIVMSVGALGGAMGEGAPNGSCQDDSP